MTINTIPAENDNLMNSQSRASNTLAYAGQNRQHSYYKNRQDLLDTTLTN
jgi:hypothetical protein